MEPRVSPKFACLSAAGFVGSTGCPALPHLLQRLRYSARVAPRSVSSGFAGDGVPSLPDPLILRRCRLAVHRVAPRRSPSVSPMIRCASRPASRIFRLRLVFAPSCPGPRALRFCVATAALGYPLSAAACRASCLFRGLPRFTCLWPRRRTNFQVSLKLQVLRRCLGLDRRVAPPFFSSAPLMLSRSFLRFRNDGWVDDESLRGSELCILSLHCG